MQKKKIFQWFSLLLIMVFVAACTQATENVTNSFPITTVSTTTVAPLTETKTPAVALTATDMPTPSSTPITIPTLLVEDAQEKWFELLATNGGCRLPCLWGITPGKSSYQDARTILMPLSSTAEIADFDSSYPEDDIYPTYIEGDLHFNTSVVYDYGTNGIIDHIAFQILEERVPIDANGEWISKTPIYGLPSFIQRTEYYSLSHLLIEQGIPDSVMIRTSGPSYNRGGSTTFYLAVFYPNQGIWAEYTTVTNESDVGSVIRSCPINSHIEMALFPPGNPDNFYAALSDQTNWKYVKEGYRPLEEVTSLTIDLFYQTFQYPTNKCIETPTELWPTPEPGGG